VKTRLGILAGGNWIVDKLKFIDTYPQQDALANIASESIANGGSPFNLLIDLARLGAGFPLAGVGLIGADSDGDWISRQCKKHRIDTAQMQVHPSAHTSYTDVMTVRSTGRRTFFHNRGANAFLDDANFDFTSHPARIFHLGYLLLLDRLDQPDAEAGTIAAKVLARAREAGFKTSVDVVSEDSQRFAQIVLPALKQVDYCILNEFELERTAGIRIRLENGIDLSALQKAAQQLLDAGVHEWVVVHFPEGACALNRAGHFPIQGSLQLPQSEIVGTVGAGDAFAAGLLYGLHENLSIETSLRYGVCVAASCLRGAGSSDAIASLNDCLKLEKTFTPRLLVP